MFSFSLPRWLKSWARPRRGKTIEKRPRRRLHLEQLEDRLAPAQTFTWSGASLVDANWSTDANWVGGVHPTGSAASLDDLVFPTAAAQKINTNDLVGATFNSISFQGSNYTLGGNQLTLGKASDPFSGFVIANSGALTDALAMDIQLAGQGGGKQFFTINNGADVTVTGKLSGSTGVELTKEGLGTLVLTADNSAFTGPITLDVNSGVMRITHALALGDDSAGTTVGAGSQLQVQSIVGGAITEPLVVSGAGFSDGALLNTAGSNTWAGTVSMDADTTFGAAAGSTLTISGRINDLASGHNLVKEGRGTIAFTTTNTYRGTTTINDGILQIQAGSTTTLVNGVPTLVSALGTTDGTAATGTTVTETYLNGTQTFLKSGTLQINDPTGTGFTVQNERLVLNGYGNLNGTLGALDNFNGFNTWTGNIIMSSGNHQPAGNINPFELHIRTDPGTTPTVSTLTVDGVVSDTGPGYTFIKTGTGTLIFTTANTYNLNTTIRQGILDIRDSLGLGTTSGTTAVTAGATLELEIDSKPDSVTTATNTLDVSETLNIAGNGVNVAGFGNVGALWSRSGINTYSGPISMVSAAIGVEPDPNPTNGINYFVNDYSLTITGAITASGTISKVRPGQLILPNPNNNITGNWTIASGWVTVDDNNSLTVTRANTSQNNQSTVTIQNGAALHLKPIGLNNLTLPQNFVLAGLGINHPFVASSVNGTGGIDNMGAIASLSGINTLVGNITLNGVAGIGVDRVFPLSSPQPTLMGGPSQLYLTRYISDGAGAGGITKLGSKMLVVQAAGSYTGPVDIQNGVWLNENATGLGDATGNTTVRSGAALLLGNMTPGQNSSQSLGEVPFGDRLILNGPGNTTLGPNYDLTAGPSLSALTVLSDPSVACLATSAPPANLVAALPSTPPVPAGSLTVTQTYYYQVTAVMASGETMPSVYASATPISAATRTINLTWDPVAGALSYNVYRRTSISPFQTPSLLANVAVTNYTDDGTAALGVGAPPPSDVISPTDTHWRGAISLNTSIAVDVRAGSRFTITGAIDDAGNPGATGSDLVKIGSGDLILVGANTYRGTTYVGTSTTYDPDIGGVKVNEFFGGGVNTPLPGHIVTIANSQGLGGTAIGEIQRLTITGSTGLFNLTFNGQTTAGFLDIASPTLDIDIQGALNSLPSIGGVGGNVIVTVLANVYTVTFGGNLAGFDLQPLSPGGPASGQVSVTTPRDGAGGTIVQDGAALQVQGNLTIAGEPLIVRGAGVSAVPATLPQTWVNIGPAPVSNGLTLGTPAAVSGRVTGITVDPTDANTIFITTAGGGAWKTENGGRIWQPLFDIQPGTPMFVGAITNVPGGVNHNTYYLGTGEADNSIDSFYGSGVYKTTDAGQTWTLVSGAETQTLTLSSLNPATDRFQITTTAGTTPLLNVNDTAANIQSALETLLGTGNVTVAGPTNITEVQQIWVNATGGQFRLTFGASTTGDLAFNDTAANVQAALNGLASINAGGGSVTVTKNSGANNYSVVFNGPLARNRQPLIVGSNGSTVLTGTVNNPQPPKSAPTGVEVFEERRGGVSYDITFAGSLASVDQPILTATATGGATANFAMSSPFNPFVGKGVSKIVYETATGNIYVASSDLTTNGTAANASPQTGPVGVWRFKNNQWFCLTNVPSDLRSGVLPAVNTSFPVWNTLDGGANFFPLVAGPEDNFFLTFPTQNAVYSDLWTSAGGYLYMAIGTPNGGGYVPPTPQLTISTSSRGTPHNTQTFTSPNLAIYTNTTVFPNGVYRITNPNTANASNVKPQWFIGNENPGGTYSNGGATAFPTGFNSNFQGDPFDNGRQNFNGPPVSGTNTNGNVKVAGFYRGGADFRFIIGSPRDNTVYASITDPATQGLSSVQRSLDGGQTWTNVSPGINYLGNAGGYDSTIGVNDTGFVNDDQYVFVGGQTGMLWSNNLGASWIDMTVDGAGAAPHAAAHAIAFDRLNNGANVLIGTDGGLWRASNQTSNPKTWSNLNTSLLEIGSYAGVSLVPSNSLNVFGGSQSNGSAQFSGGQSWTAVTNAITSSTVNHASVERVDPNNPNNVYTLVLPQTASFPNGVTFPTGTLYRSLTGGGAGSYGVALGGVTGFSVDPVTTNRLLATGPGFIRESLNGGTTWTLLDTTGSTFISGAAYQGKYTIDVSFPAVTDKGSNTYDPDTIYTASGQSIRVSKNHGVTWVTRAVTGMAAAGANIADFLVDPRNRDTIYVVSNRFGDDTVRGASLYKSTDAGQTWIDMTGLLTSATDLPDMPTWKVVLDPRYDDLYLGTDRGVYKAAGAAAITTQAAADSIVWNRFGQGLPNVQVRDIYLDQTQNTLTVATYGRSIYQIWLNNAQANYGALGVPSGSVVWTGPIQLAGDTNIRVEGTQILQNGVSAAKLNIVGSISDLFGTSNNKVNKDGGGFLILSGSNNYTGKTEVRDGVIIANNVNALGSPVGDTTVDTGKALWIEADLQQETVHLNGDGIPFGDHNTGSLRNISNFNTFTGTLVLDTDATIGADTGSSLTIGSKAGLLGTGAVTGNQNLVKELTGTLILAGPNTFGGSPFTISVQGAPNGSVPTTTFAGGALVAQGALSFGHNQALGLNGNTVTVLNGAQLQMQGNINVAASQNQTMRLSGTGISGTGALQNIGGNNRWGGQVILERQASFNPAAAAPFTIAIGALLNDTGDILTIDGKITDGSNNYGLTKVGPGTIALNNNTNDYDGLTTVATGILRQQQPHALGNVGGIPGPSLVTIAATNNSGQGYVGITSPTGFVPPDTDGAAGAFDYVETVNSEVRLYNNKNTGALPVTRSLATFFASLPISYGFYFDPAVLYHDNIPGMPPDQGRYIIMCEDANPGLGLSVIDIAVSKTNDPSNLTTDWWYYQIVTNETGGLWADYPGNPGYNQDALVLTFNMFTPADVFQHAQIIAIDIDPLINGGSLTLGTDYFSTDDLTHGSLRPATMHDAAPGDPMWLVTAGAGNSIDVIRMTNVLSPTPTYITTTIGVTPFLGMAAPRNPNNSIITNSIDTRIQKAAVANNTLVASHSVGLTATQDEARWYSIDVGSGVPAMNDSGAVTGGNNTYVMYPSIDINRAGTIGMTYMMSGTDTPTNFMSMWITGRAPTDPVGTMETPVLVPAGTGSGNNTDGRAGDLSGINVDPIDGSFWAANEFTGNSGSWRTAIANFSVGPTGSPPGYTVVQNGAALEIDSVPSGGGAFTVMDEGVFLNGPGTPEVQTVTITGASGLFTLSFNGSAPTPNLNYNASAAQVQTALNNLATIGGAGGFVTVTKSGATFVITFFGSLAGQNLVPLDATGTASPVVATFREGGTGALRNISGDNTWAGSTGTVTLQTNSSIGVDAGTNLTITADVSDTTPNASVPSPDLTKVGTGTLLFPDANPYTGATLINEGILAIQDPGSLGAVVDEVQTITLTGPLTGSFRLRFNGSPTGLLSANYSGTNPTFISDIQNALNSLPTINAGGGFVTVASVLNAPSSFTVTFNGGPLAGKNQNQLIGTGFSGTGIIVVTTRDGSEGTTVAAGATLQLRNIAAIGPETTEYLTLNGLGYNGRGALENLTGNNLWDVPITLASDASIGVDSGTTLTVDQPISENGGVYALAKLLPGTLEFTGSTSNAYTGLTDVQDGILLLNKSGGAQAILGDLKVGDSTPASPLTDIVQLLQSNQIANSSTVTVNSDGWFDLNDQTEAIGPLNITDGLVTTGAGTHGVQEGSLTASSLDMTRGTLTLQTSGSQAIFNGNVTELDAVINDGGSMTVNGLLTMTGGQINLTGLLTLGGNVHATSDSVAPGTATITGAGTVSLGGTTRTFTIDPGTQAVDMNISSTIAGAGAEGITKAGLGRLALGGNNTYTGVTTINAGDVQVNTGGVIKDVVINATADNIASISGRGTVGKINRAASSATFILTLAGFTAGQKFKLNYSNGAQSGQTNNINYSGAPATDAANIQNALTVLFASLSLGGAANVSGVVGNNFTIVITGTAANNILPITGTPVAPATGTFSLREVNQVNPGYNGGTWMAGTLTTTNDVTFTSDTDFFVDLGNASNTHPTPVAGTDYDQLFVGGNINLGHAYLTGATHPGIAINDTFTIIQTTGTITAGTFLDGFNGTARVTIPQDGTVFIGGQKFTVHYNPNSVVLTRAYLTATVAITRSLPSPTLYGQIVTFTATVTPEAGGLLPPSGATITFTVDQGPSQHVTGAIPLSGNQVTFDPQALFGVWSVPSTRTIDARFDDSGNSFQTAFAPQISHVVNKSPTTVTSVTSSPTVTPTTPVYGQQVTLTANFAPNTPPNETGALNPGGTATFTFDPATSPVAYTVAVNSGAGTATLGPASSPVLPILINAGSHPIRVIYDGDANYLASPANNTLTLTVQKDNTSINVTPAAPSTNFGQLASFSVQVNRVLGTAGTPNGTVALYEGATLLDSKPYSGGTVTLQTANLSRGTHSLTVTFIDTDGNYNNSSTAPFSYTINKAGTTTAIVSASPSASTFGDPVTFTIQISPSPAFVNPALFQPTGTVTLWDGVPGVGNNLGTQNVNPSTGQAIIISSALIVGSHTLNAVYTGDASLIGSSGSLAGYNVSPVSTTTTVTANPSSGAVFGQSVTFTATITSTAGPPPANCTVLFEDTTTATTLGTRLTNASGVATISTSGLAVGSHNIRATFTDTVDSNFLGSVGTLNNYVVSKVNTTTTVAASPTSTFYGQTVTFTATVTAATANPPIGAGSTVTFMDTTTGTPLGSANLVAGGTASISTNVLIAGSHTITATYTDTADNNFNGSSGSLTNFIVNKAVTSMTLSASPSSGAVYGQNVTFTATVTSTTATPPTGAGSTVTFVDTTTGTTLGNADLTAGGVASINTSVLTATTHTIVASYADTQTNNFAPTSRTLFGYIVGAAPTTTTVSGSPPSSVYHQSATFTAHVTSPGGNPPVNSQVKFVDSTTGTTLGTGFLDSFGFASISTTVLTATTHTITATYTDTIDTNFSSSFGTLTGYVVAPANTSTSVSANPSSGLIFGQSVTLTATVTSPAGIPPQGSTVTFKDDLNNTLGTGILNASGQASISTSALPAGTRTISATYHDSVDTNYADSTGTLSGYVVGTAATTTFVSAQPPSGAVYGQTVTIQARVTSPTATVTTGATSTVTFYADSTSNPPLGSANLVFGGTATITVNSLSVATHDIIAVYTDTTGNFGGSTGILSGYTVGKAVTTTALTATPASGDVFGQNVVLKAAVSSTTATPPNGAGSNVVFFDVTTGTTLGNANLSGGVATINTTALTVTTHQITATYSDTADNNFAGSTGTLNNYVVGAANTFISSFTGTPSAPGVNQPVTLKAVASAQNPSMATVNGGTITFVDVTNPGAPVTLGVVNVDGTGLVSMQTSFSTTGTHNLTAQYNGLSPNFNGSAAASLSLTVRKASAINVGAVSGVVYGQTINYSVSVSGAPGTPTGTITVIDLSNNNASYGPFTLSGGSTTASIPNLSAGSHNLRFSYSGDTTPAPGFAPSTRDIVQTVAQAATTVTISPASDSSFYGQVVNLTATITGSTGVNPTTGAVRYYDLSSNTVLGTVNLNGSSNMVNLQTGATLLSAGSHDIRAQYLSSTNFAASSLSASRTQNVAKAATVTTLAALNSPTSYGAAATFQATVTANSPGTPGVPTTGQVGFVADNSIVLGYASVNNSGVATFSTTQLNAGNHVVQAIYVGSANFDVSGYSNVVSHNVNPATTAMVLASSAPNGAAYGNAVTFAATVGVPGSSAIPTGSVTFKDGATVLATVQLNSSGVAVFTSTATQFAPGSHAITATYTPDTGNFTGVNKSLNQNVTLAATATVLTSSPSFWAINQNITFTAAVNVTSGGTPGVPQGFVQFNIDGNLTTVVVDGAGKANMNFTFNSPNNTPVGNHTVSATYFPKTNPTQFFAGSASAPQTQNVRRASQIVLAATPGNGGANLSATVSPQSGSGTPTGTVTFYEYVVVNGVGQYNAFQNGTVTLVNGVANFFAPLNDSNTHTIVATYSGDTDFNPAVTARNLQNGRLV